MTKRNQHKHVFVGITLAIALGNTGVRAEESEPLSQLCELCGDVSGWEFDIEAGLGYVSDDNFKFGDYTGLEDDGLYLFGDVFARYWGKDAEFLRFDGYRLGQDSRALFIEGGKQDQYKVRASYQGIPRRIFDTTFTPYLGSGSDTLTLPAGWVPASTTQGMTQLNNSLRAVNIERDWDIYSAGVGYTPNTNWAFNIDYRRQEREGNAVSSGSFFIDAAMFASPVDDATDEVEVSAAYNEKTWQLSLSYLGSFYDNDNTSLDWDNPYTPQTPGADTGRLALAPDNDSHQITLAGSMLLPARTTLNGFISMGRMEQDEGYLPYTSNALIAASTLPRFSANAKVDTTKINLRAVSSPWQKITVQGEFKYNERDNKTQENNYDYVVTDLFNSANSARNIAYNYKRYDYRLRGEYRLPGRTRFYTGYEHERYERTRQERDETTTNRVWAQVRMHAFDGMDANIKGYIEDRDGDSYNAITYVASPQNPLMRKYNLADRQRNGFKAQMSAYVGDRLNIGAEMEYNNDTYDNSVIGLQDSQYTRYGLDASYLFVKDISVYGSIYLEDIESLQTNSQTFSSPDWKGTTDDSFYTGTFGVRYPQILGRMDASLEYSFARSDSKTGNDTGGLTSEFPTQRSKLHQIKLGLQYPYNKSMSFSFKYWYENFETEDWSLEGVEPATVPNLLSLGADPYDYDNHVFFIGMRYVFDTRGQAGPRMNAGPRP